MRNRGRCMNTWRASWSAPPGCCGACARKQSEADRRRGWRPDACPHHQHPCVGGLSMAETSLLSRRRMLKLGLTGAAGATLIGAPVDVKLAKPPGLWTPGGVVLPRLPSLALAGAQDVGGVPTYILPPIIVTPPYGSVTGDYNVPAGIDYGYNSSTNGFGNRIYQAVLRQKAIDAQRAQQQAIADQWNGIYNVWMANPEIALWGGEDAARVATEMEWRGVHWTQTLMVLKTLAAATVAIRASQIIRNDPGIVPMLAEVMRQGGMVVTLTGLTVGFSVGVTAVTLFAVGIALIYIAITRFGTPDGLNYVGIRSVSAPADGSGDLIYPTDVE